MLNISYYCKYKTVNIPILLHAKKENYKKKHFLCGSALASFLAAALQAAQSIYHTLHP